MIERRQGSQANRTGKVLENMVESVFASHGYQTVRYDAYAADPGMPGDLLVRNVPYRTIYGHKGKSEFLVVSRSLDAVFRIECKWQQATGSVDEKYPYVIENCKTMPEPMIIILIDGGGYKEGALQWLKQAAEKCRLSGEKDIWVFNMVDFTTWANKTL